MKKEQILGIIRHTLTFLGGVFVFQGKVDQEVIDQLLGASTTIIGIIWSIFSKQKDEN